MNDTPNGGPTFPESHYISELQLQMARDSVWCLPCGMYNQRKFADVIYTVEKDDLSARVPACRSCFLRELKHLPISASEPVVQPAYIAIADAMLAARDAAKETR